ncbi:MAG: adenylate kinase [Kastovskya adunca ATA6-11-RM4]|jgi:adenylate kinase|nr:adenylate kinase [Kastovskya adunca ATA6-11-RM4]
MTKLIFLGPPGAGKGTQAQLLAEQLHIPHISTGDIFRQARAAQSSLGLQVQSYMDRGALVPDELTQELVRERLSQPDAEKGWILDGFPRTVSQADFLEQLLKELNQPYNYVINLVVPEEVLVERLLERGHKQGRTDDTQEVIAHRLKVYNEQTAPVIGFYSDRQQLLSIDGNRSLDAVTESLMQQVAP